ncbi:hypothetical protein D5085_08125 [Ectothiorhodospiraceae bacterium BW-2]|nr:hypothetical protein D5085_08125 [Ectothiorhodospiraceae bacterium BW-2]
MSSDAFFVTEAQEQQLDLLTHLIQFGDEVLIVTGEEGSGKTTLMARIEQRLQTRWSICCHDALAEPLLSQLFPHIASAARFDDSTSDPEHLIADFQHHLSHTFEQDSLLVMVDSAEQLEGDALQALLYLASLQHDGTALIRVVLIALPDLKLRLMQPELAPLSKKSRLLSIDPIASNQIEPFIQFLQQQGRIEQLPDAKLLRQIIRRSRGNPQQILLQLQLPQIASAAGVGIGWPWIGGVAVVIVTLSALLWVDFGQLATDTAPKTAPSEGRVELKPESETRPDEPFYPNELARQLAQQQLAEEPVRALVEPRPLLPPAAEQPLMAEEDRVTPAQERRPDTSVAVAQEPLQVENSEIDSLEPSAVSPEPVVTVTDPEPEPEPEPLVATEEVGEVGGESENNADWLASQPPQNYTIQLIALSDASAITRFVQERGLQGELVEVTTTKNSRPLYTLIEGSYRDRAAAMAAVTKLPQGISTWVRTLESLQSQASQSRHLTSPVAPKRVAGEREEGGQTTTERQAADPIQSRDVAWLWSQQPDLFTIQLISSSERERLEQFARQYDLATEAVIIATKREQRAWYQLFYGTYTSRSEALVAIGLMADELQRSRPWVRSYGAVQEDMGADSAN